MRAIVFAALMIMAGSTDAVAEDRACRVPEAGTWKAHKPAMKSLSRVEIEGECRGEDYFLRVRIFTRCAPRDCKWGWSEGVRIGSRVVADFTGLFGTRKVTLTAMESRMEAMVSSYPHDPTSPEEHYTVILGRH
ncbi:hypothetical protein H2509_07435 [Stappia sp. F7233]|uniref:Uncharacterized protein n=1 Tax=Stappia albiluteola TaxID=2758565 RepID=A0A839ADH4_9HYPH|nr:hypothetical protein [Stappia albiluteola]MBA5776962.1 hypothetical protein [Stappia albiluteola]